jgi:hypothetical protein
LKKKVKLLIIGMSLLLMLSLALVGCSTGISQDEYDAVVAERDAANADLQAAQAQIVSLQGNITGLQGNITALQAEIAALKLPDVLAILSAVDEVQTWAGNATNTTLLAAVTKAVNDSGDQGLKQKWDAFLAAAAQGNVRFELFQFYGYMLGSASEVAAAFPATVRPLMEVGDEMEALVASLDVALLGQTTVAINASGNQELINRWNQIMGTFGTSLPQAMKMMAEMQVWMLGQIAAAAPTS